METTHQESEALSLEQAVDLMVEPEQPETEAVEAETEQPEPDLVDEAEADEVEAEAEDVIEDDDDDDEADIEDDDEGDIEETEDSDEAEEPVAELDKLHTVKVNGQEVEVPLRELLRDYSGQKFIQQGMQENARLKKEAEGAFAALTQERQQLQELMQHVQSGALTPPVQPDPAAFRDDPFGWHEAQMEYAEKSKAYEQQAQAVQRQLEQQAQADVAMRQQYAKAEAAELVKQMPELAEPKHAETFYKTVTEGAKAFGYSAEEVQNISSHRDMLVLHAAMKWLETQGGDSKKIVAEKSKKARPKIKAGAKKTTSAKRKHEQMRNKLKRSGSIDDALALMLDPNLK